MAGNKVAAAEDVVVVIYPDDVVLWLDLLVVMFLAAMGLWIVVLCLCPALIHAFGQVRSGQGG